WWDDLWLNESFADLLGYLAVDGTEQDLGIPEGETLLRHSSRKEWGYDEDSFETTHPVIAEAEDTNAAMSNFDGITYSKGGASLWQLIYYIGYNNFVKGVQKYFAENKWGNRTRDDFMRYLSESSGIDLSKWQAEWLKTRGANKVKVIWTKSGGRSVVKVVQGRDPFDKKLRTHRMKVGVFKYDSKGHLKLASVVPVTYSGEKTDITELLSEFPTEPDLVIPNYGDYDYVEVKLSKKSLRTVERDLQQVEDPQARLIIWSSLFRSIRDAEVAALDVCQIAIKHLGAEKNISVLSSALSTAIGYLSYISPSQTKESTRKQFEALAVSQFQLVSQMPNSDKKKQLQLTWLEWAIGLSRSNSNLRSLKSYLASGSARGYELDQSLRWEIIKTLNRYNDPDGIRLLNLEKQRDGSYTGQKGAIVADVVRPDEQNKRLWWDRITKGKARGDQDELTLNLRLAAMGGFFLSEQESQTAFAQPFYFDQFEEISEAEDPYFMRYFSSSFVPSVDLSGAIQAIEVLLRNDDLTTPVRKNLIKTKTRFERRQRGLEQSAKVCAKSLKRK
ncbi:MAG: ERAP1-like C-terminal domain-containing protein, partial [Bdellovibrionales bacterium]|nr:ERAP1-like C-terminal domain-containing protein [Bdellovibrionales bacterium]